jgi:hypothetical protein
MIFIITLFFAGIILFVWSLCVAAAWGDEKSEENR